MLLGGVRSDLPNTNLSDCVPECQQRTIPVGMKPHEPDVALVNVEFPYGNHFTGETVLLCLGARVAVRLFRVWNPKDDSVVCILRQDEISDELDAIDVVGVDLVC